MPASSPSEDDVVSLMKELGFTTSEAKVYLALLKQNPATGYDLATRSDVPRSAIYGILHRLEAVGLVNAVQDKPAKYVPISPDRLHRTLEARFSKNLGDLKTGLEKIVGRPKDALTWTLHGYAPMIAEAESLIRRAETSVHGSIWSREAERLAEPLRDALGRGLDLVLFSFNPLPDGLGDCALSYGIAESELEEFWSHKIILVADKDRALLGGAEDGETNRAVVTDESALVEMALSNLILDITLLGQRHKRDVEDIVVRLTKRFAPIEKLVPKGS